MKKDDMSDTEAQRIRTFLEERQGKMLDFLRALALAESPSDEPSAQREVQALLSDALRDLDYEVRHIRGRATGGHLYARSRDRAHGAPAQLVMGHCDTVWPVGTLRTMPVEIVDGRMSGPGVFDMKGGLTQALFALRALRELGLTPPATPVVFINSDEEIGSPESRRWVRLLARRVARVWIPEPAFGPTGKLKTARKGVGEFTVRIHGKAAHAGLDPEGGASAIQELSHVIQEMHALTDLPRGVTVNVGVVEGGLRRNVVAPHARADVDVRVLTMDDARRVEEAIRRLRPRTAGVTLEVEGGLRAPPLERTPRNRRLWEAALAAGRALGVELEEVTSGGGSDGNTTSRYTATLDGLGPVGDGAHARHEFVLVDGLVERAALLAKLLLAPLDAPGR